MKIVTTAITVALAATLSTAAFASEKSIRVSYSDLDLSSEAGQKVLNRRIAQAASSACGQTSSRMPLALEQKISACISQTTAQAVKSVEARRTVQFVSR